MTVRAPGVPTAPEPDPEPTDPHPTQTVLLANVARRFYLDGQSKTEIADALAISRFRVARLIEVARETGVVRIEITTSGALDTEVSLQLQAAYGLQHALVLDLPGGGDEASLRRRLGQTTAGLLTDVVTAADVIGLAWARSLHPMGSALRQLPPCPVVQLTGALSREDGVDVLELVRAVARRGGGPAHVFYAPMVAPDVATAAAIRRQADVVRVSGLFGSVTVAAVGIGSWAPGLSTVHDAFSRADRAALRRAGVVADISGVLVDADGVPVDDERTRQVIGMTAAELRAIDTVVAVAYGVGKAAAVAGALRGGLVTSLVTHRELAEALLERGR